MSYTDELISLNNVKRKKLNNENLEMYEKILTYLRAEWRLSDRYTEEVLNDLLDHLLESQENGMTTEEFFSDDPEQFAKDLVAEIPEHSKRNAFIFIAALFFISIGYLTLANGFAEMIISFFNKPQKSFNLLSFVIGYSLMFIMFLTTINYILKELQKEEFKPESSKRNKILSFLFLLLISSLVFAAFISPLVFIKIGPEISIPWFYALPIGAVIIFIGRYLLKYDS